MDTDRLVPVGCYEMNINGTRKERATAQALHSLTQIIRQSLISWASIVERTHRASGSRAKSRNITAGIPSPTRQE
jgi:hypothetical protein